MFTVAGPTSVGEKQFVRIDDIHDAMPVGLEALKNPSILIAESTRYKAWDFAEDICQLLNEKMKES